MAFYLPQARGKSLLLSPEYHICILCELVPTLRLSYVLLKLSEILKCKRRHHFIKWKYSRFLKNHVLPYVYISSKFSLTYLVSFKILVEAWVCDAWTMEIDETCLFRTSSSVITSSVMSFRVVSVFQHRCKASTDLHRSRGRSVWLLCFTTWSEWREIVSVCWKTRK